MVGLRGRVFYGLRCCFVGGNRAFGAKWTGFWTVVFSAGRCRRSAITCSAWPRKNEQELA